MYQYKVKANDFKLNRNQRQAMTRFHRYLATGSVNAVPKPVVEGNAAAAHEEVKDAEMSPQSKQNFINSNLISHVISCRRF